MLRRLQAPPELGDVGGKGRQLCAGRRLVCMHLHLKVPAVDVEAEPCDQVGQARRRPVYIGLQGLESLGVRRLWGLGRGWLWDEKDTSFRWIDVLAL